MAITQVKSNYTGAEKPLDCAPKKQEATDKAYKNAKE